MTMNLYMQKLKSDFEKRLLDVDQNQSFVPINKNIGVKVFFTAASRNAAKARQRLAQKHGLAPRVYDSFNTDVGGCNLYCYFTQMALIIPQSEDKKYEVEVFYPGLFSLMKKLAKIGLSPRDHHLGNIGYLVLKGKPKLVWLDFDCCSMG